VIRAKALDLPQPKDMRISRPTVQLWRKHFLDLRIPGLEKDAPRRE
jgi:hypothetical protein